MTIATRPTRIGDSFESDQMAQACLASAGTATRAAWVYLVTYASGDRGYWIRFTQHPEARVDDVSLQVLAGYRSGRCIALPVDHMRFAPRV